MKDEIEKEEFVKERIADFIGKTIWILVHVLPALVAGRFFGIVTERIVFCLMLTVTCLKQIEALEAVKELIECTDAIVERVEARKRAAEKDEDEWKEDKVN